MMLLPTTATRSTWLILLLTTIQSATIMAQDGTSINSYFTTSTRAADPSSSPSPTTFQSSISTSSPGPQTHTIQVGLLDHKMRPETTDAAVGDTIEFHFYPLNHSIVRAEYGFPCIPYEMTGANKKGFFSGFNYVNRVPDNPPKYSVRVNDTEPIFFYCSAPGSCITYGMVGGINLNSSMSIDRQKTLAMDSSYMLQPGEPFPAESPLPSVNPASLLPSSTSTSSSTSTPAANTQHSSSGLSKGAIAGIVVAGVCAILLSALLFFCWGRTKSLREELLRKDGAVHHVNASPNQMAEYKQPNVHVQHHHTTSEHGAYQFPTHPNPQPQSVYAYHSPGNGVPQNTTYLPPTHPLKYTPTPASYHAHPASSPPETNYLPDQMYTHPATNQTPTQSTPAPGYYEMFSRPTPSHEPRVRPVEMEAITLADPARPGGVGAADKDF